MAPLERLKILMQVQGNAKVYTGVWQVRAVLKAGLPFCLWHPIVLHVTPWPPRAWRMAARDAVMYIGSRNSCRRL